MDFGGHVGAKNPSKNITHLGSPKSLKCVRRYHGSTIFKVPGLQKIIENLFKILSKTLTMLNTMKKCHKTCENLDLGAI